MPPHRLLANGEPAPGEAKADPTDVRNAKKCEGTQAATGIFASYDS